ncbi:MAG: hypothetical protein ACR2KK_07825 [Acidimicrobiales bacterium]
MTPTRTWLRHAGEQGALALNYWLFIVLIALACGGAVAVMNGWADDLFESVRRIL